MSENTKITLRQLEIFLSVVEHRNFQLAAKQLELTPPAVSMQMSRLSEELGALLFDKAGRSIQLTEAATALVPYAERVTNALSEAQKVISDMQGEWDNQVRVAMVTTSRNFGPHLLQAFKQKYPDVKLKTTIANRSGVIEQLGNGQVDLALMGRTPRRLKVEEAAFADHPYVLICSPDHPLTKFKKIKKKDLSGHKFLVREEGSGTRKVHDHFFMSSGVNLPRSQEMGGNENIKQAVMANMGIAFLSRHTIDLELQAGKLSILDVVGMPELRQWYVMYPKGKRLSPAAMNFKKFVLDHGPAFMDAFFK